MSLLKFLNEIPDSRGKQGRKYELGNVLYICILGLLSGATSYRKLHLFMKTHYLIFKDLLELEWPSSPAYTKLRDIIQGVEIDSFEALFRKYSAELVPPKSGRFIAADGKTLRGSFDHLSDQRAIQLFSVFAVDSDIILAHEEISEKTNEIPAFQELVSKIGLKGCIFTLDAIHCQKKHLNAS